MAAHVTFAAPPEDDPVVARAGQLYLNGKAISGSFFSEKEQVWSCDVLSAKPDVYRTESDIKKRVFARAKDGLVLSYNKYMENTKVLWVGTKNGLESNIEQQENSTFHILHRNVRYDETNHLLIIETSENSKYFISAINEGRCPSCKDHPMSEVFPSNFLISFEICKRVE